ncbi:MAG TPA: GNAT family N-acetyltransferase, partial [Dehalococcoidia bacterium]|nr:GNAT family N-acetyltransferase [Dehalococcoidia bacterium]
DMLVRLYALPSASSWEARAASLGIRVRRADAWDRYPLRSFIREHFGDNWAGESELAFSGHPITCFVAVRDGEIVGFAAYECTRRGFFGPTGVREDVRGSGAGAVLLFRCLESMREMGYAYAIIGGVGPADYYAKVCGATVIDGSDPGIYADLYQELRGRGNARPR